MTAGPGPNPWAPCAGGMFCPAGRWRLLILPAWGCQSDYGSHTAGVTPMYRSVAAPRRGRQSKISAEGASDGAGRRRCVADVVVDNRIESYRNDLCLARDDAHRVAAHRWGTANKCSKLTGSDKMAPGQGESPGSADTGERGISRACRWVKARSWAEVGEIKFKQSASLQMEG